MWFVEDGFLVVERIYVEDGWGEDLMRVGKVVVRDGI